jgi:hypothetical protein
MREYDDDNISHYAPVLRRIIILVAVITAVPVMLWTITAFMHTYIAQPTIPSPQPLAAATAPPASPAVDTANPPAPSQPAPSVTDARASDDGAGNNAAPNVQVASTATISPAPSAAPAAPAAPAAITVQAAPAAPSPSVFPDPPTAASPSQRLPPRTLRIISRPTTCRLRIRLPVPFPCRGIVRACWRFWIPPYRCRGPVRATPPNLRARRPTRHRPATIPASGINEQSSIHSSTAPLARRIGR